ncbi:hypothetical protein CTAYLR_007205 [Chrysophaeum taylorii]|uniref:Uncharacterized protein n=1 Tax=Chrysophaeum taylorii TaxID=2483200 RepID=A0AAD7XMS9_9STRA|nr:hypothetical protein CTAYLR_007205 [Chrysophaeum taylorii]
MMLLLLIGASAFPRLALYTPVTNISEYARFDLALEALSDSMRPPREVAGATAAYERTFAGVSLKTMQARSIPHSAVYGPNWADYFVAAAISGSSPFEGWEDDALRELATKGAAYANTLFYVLYLLEEGVVECENTWDRAWAYFAGSREGETGDGSGFSAYALGDKRCPQFGTCEGSRARNNELARLAWEKGRDGILKGDCLAAYDQLRVIKPQLIVPLIQGALREAYEVDPEGGAEGADGTIEVAEGWAFVYPLLPLVYACDSNQAQVIYRNMFINADPILEDGYEAVKDAFESVYDCLNVTCYDVGAMQTCGDENKNLPCWDPCSDSGDDDDHKSDSKKKSARVVAIVVVGVAGWLFALFLVVLVNCQRRLSTSSHPSHVDFASSELIKMGEEKGEAVA